MTEKKGKNQKAKKGKIEEKKEFLPPLDFSSLAFPFFTQALIKLGQAEDPITKKNEVNLEFAKRLIDLLDLLKDRTKGNLKLDEEKFLSASLHQLKMIYMEKAKIIKL
ncbi:MAG: DUF1844 domain-containing protein [Candidatus Aminicenantaceae bacterium]